MIDQGSMRVKHEHYMKSSLGLLNGDLKTWYMGYSRHIHSLKMVEVMTLVLFRLKMEIIDIKQEKAPRKIIKEYIRVYKSINYDIIKLLQTKTTGELVGRYEDSEERQSIDIKS